MKKLLIFLVSIGSWVTLTAGDDFCGIRNTSFKSGEVITYNVFYALMGIYVNAGTATFTTSLENMGSRPVYHVLATGTSNTKYDWIFKVRDRYETFFDTATLRPLKFVRSVDEGGYKKFENISFNQQANTAVTPNGVYKVPLCVQDVLSAVYNARNLDFNRFEVNDKIPFAMFMDNEVFNLYIRYLGRETIKTKYGKFRCFKFRPLLVKGTMFEGGENMLVWVTDDGNHIPIRIESPIVVGSVKVDMMQYKNLRYPVTSMISWK